MKWWNEVRHNWRWWLTPKYRYAVITELPEDQDGNCYDELLTRRPFNIGFGPDEALTEECLCIARAHDPQGKHERARLPVFQLGELLVVNRSGREIGGVERKPDKWFVECEYFNRLHPAVKRSLEVRRKHYGY